VAVAAAIAVAVALLVAGPSHEHPATTGASALPTSAFAGAALPGGLPAPGFTLIDQSGHSASLLAYRGQVVVLAFLYSRCAPACVLIAQQVRGALDQLARPVPVLLVSVDPAADTPAHVRAFLAQVGLAGRARFLSGPRAALAAVWREYHVVRPSAGRSAFEAAASVLLIDRGGRERVIYQQEQLTPEALAHDINRLQSPPNAG
jgi:cytochrome oxidase Cu insertion factor (SCO1/SenC/PrrC family)